MLELLDKMLLKHPFILLFLLMAGGAALYICLPRKTQLGVFGVCVVLLLLILIVVCMIAC